MSSFAFPPRDSGRKAGVEAGNRHVDARDLVSLDRAGPSARHVEDDFHVRPIERQHKSAVRVNLWTAKALDYLGLGVSFCKALIASHEASPRDVFRPFYDRHATAGRSFVHNSPTFSGGRLTQPPAVTRVHLGEYSGHFLQGASAPFIPDFESPVEEPDGDNFRLMHDGFEDEREPLDRDEYVRLVHRWNVALAVVLVVICLGLVLVGGK